MADPKPIRLAAAKLGPGSIVDGRYRVVRVLGSGGTGIVHEVEQIKTGQKYAMKTLLDAGNAARLEQEARALMRLRTRHAIKVFDLGSNDRVGPYLVMNLLEGQTMRQLLDERRQLDLSTIANLTMQVAECLDEAHSLGLVHRDLKPDNIHLTPIAGGLFEVTVLDFGVVKVQAHDADVGLTRTGSTIGTPYYMSLEQLRGASTVDALCDVYSLSVMLYESLAGVVPFKASNLGDLVYAICSSPAPHLSTIRADLPPEILDTIMRGLASKKDQRPASMREVANAFLKHAEPSFSLWLRTTTHTRPPEEWANLLTAPLLPSGEVAPSPQGPVAKAGAPASAPTAPTPTAPAPTAPPPAAPSRPTQALPPLEASSNEAPTRVDPVQAGIAAGPASTKKPVVPRATLPTSQPPPPVRLKAPTLSPGAPPASPRPPDAAATPADPASLGDPWDLATKIEEPRTDGDRETPTEMFVKERHLPEEDLAAFSGSGDRSSAPTIAIPPHLAAASMAEMDASMSGGSLLSAGETTTVLAVPDEVHPMGTARMPRLSQPSLANASYHPPGRDSMASVVRAGDGEPRPGGAKTSVDEFMRQVGSVVNEMTWRGRAWFRAASPRAQTTAVVLFAASGSILLVLLVWIVVG